MHSKILYIYDSIKLFEVLNEIKNFLNFAIKYIDKKDVNKINFSSPETHLVISLNFFDQNLNFIKIDNTPISIQKLVEVINLNFIKKQFWGYTSDLETHTVETHIYRLRKKMKKIFQDDNFIGFKYSKYYLIK